VRALFLTTEFPWPTISGGRVRTFGQLSILDSLADVQLSVVSLREEAIEPSALSALRAKLPRAYVADPVFHPIHLKAHRAYLPWVAGVRVIGRLPYLAAKWVSPRVHRAIARELRHGADVVHVDHLGMAAYVSLIRRMAPRARLVLDQHNVESDFFAQFRDRKRGVVRAIAGMEYKAARAYEERTVAAFDHVVAISEDDATTFRTMGAKSVSVVPQVIRFKPVKRERPARPRLVYLGNLGWHPNVEGLNWFFKEVWPRLHAARPELTLTVGGSGLKTDARGKPIVPPEWLAPNAEIIGFVDDLDAFYKDATAFIAPILGGSGVRIKILEAFRAGLPLIATYEGALGLPLEDGVHGVIAKTPDEFAAGTLRVVDDAKLWQSFVDRGYAYLDSAHSLKTASRVMRGAYGLGAES